MKKLLILFYVGLVALSASAQQNASLVAQLPYEQAVNDIWGWAAEDSTEYALVGTQTGVSVVSLADPTQPVEVAFAPGPNSTWRDMKTWNNHAYAINETDEGLLVMDLSGLPDTMTYFYWSPLITELGGQLSTCHNIYIDEFGVAYLAGCNLNSGGIIFVDVAKDQNNPTFIGNATNVYAHDVYTDDNLMYTSDIFVGNLTIHDVTDKEEPIILATQQTPFRFTHNAWANADQTVVFTTDERANAPIAAYDISDLENIVELDQFRPQKTIGTNVIPHNVHVLDNYVIASHYTDGVVIIDADRPHNLIEVSSWDTELNLTDGFNGAWGAYPFLPSGLVLGSDRGNGLFVIEAEYKRAAYFEGLVVDSVTQEPLVNARVRLLEIGVETTEFTNFEGNFATGVANSGTYMVEVSRLGYVTKTVELELENGVLTERRFELEPIPEFSVIGRVIDRENRMPIPSAQISILGEENSYEAATGEDGAFEVENIFAGNYQIIVGAWGYEQRLIDASNLESNQTFEIELDRGYEDDFVLDLGWTVVGGATTGNWERGEPIGTQFGNGLANPEFDLPNDLGTQCYVTGNAGGSAGTDDVDDGSTELISPLMDLTTYANPELSYQLWFVNAGGDGSPNDSLSVYLSNGDSEVLLETVTTSVGAWNLPSVFRLNELIEITNTMQIRFVTADQVPPQGHLVEAGVDGFQVVDAVASSTDMVVNESQVQVFPNPFTSALQITLAENITNQQAVTIELYDAYGRMIKQYQTQQTINTFELGTNLPEGIYYLKFIQQEELFAVRKLVKTGL